MDEKEAGEALEGATPIPNGLPEAPASANIKFWIDGYGVMLTMRDEKIKEVVKKLEFVISYAKSKGWKSTWKTEEKPAQPANCQHPDWKEFTVKKEGKNKGKQFRKCEDCGRFEWL